MTEKRGRIILGPMEGVLDALMREMLTEINDYDLCVTEFVRVVDRRLPESVFFRLCPELEHGGVTPSGTPVRVQLLGQDENWLAENAVRAIDLGSPGVDINFGCPAKTVNRNRGGATLLKDPEQIYRIVKASKEAIDQRAPLSAKVRLGWDNPSQCDEVVDAVYQAGANELTIHARTKEDGYKAEAIKWHYIDEMRQKYKIPLIANGEIWDYASAEACRDTTGCEDVMVCRGALNLPNLGNVAQYNTPPMPWSEVIQLLLRYSQFEIEGIKAAYYPNRIKQWFSYLRHQYPQAKVLFGDIRTLKKIEDIIPVLRAAAERA
ncbi:tRNA dihydrouridine(16) synthase DusC [Thaumasiovibrio subtropicus]|uniref:tRNA dihydrouridine(16) synthase DusC n=1 Tax=Thaumasiovibrio subtropicus TaxID=1891207 RepID=UPI000B3527A8|nr:tRNA dihydrouridine(16) synthase DusC [Thaumasiovibrio subtropicus]